MNTILLLPLMRKGEGEIQSKSPVVNNSHEEYLEAWELIMVISSFSGWECAWIQQLPSKRKIDPLSNYSNSMHISTVNQNPEVVSNKLSAIEVLQAIIAELPVNIDWRIAVVTLLNGSIMVI